MEAVFDTTRLRAPLGGFLEKNGIESSDDGQLLIKRTFTAAGQNRQFVNGSPTTLQILEGLGEFLVDIHGPHDHQSLLHPRGSLRFWTRTVHSTAREKSLRRWWRRRFGRGAQSGTDRR